MAEADNWKWWYYVLAGICIAGYDIWKTYDTDNNGYLDKDETRTFVK